MILLRDVEGSTGGLGSLVGTVSIAGANWSLYSGTNNVWNVYQYIRSESTQSATFDLMDFMDDLVGRGLMSETKYLLSI